MSGGWYKNILNPEAEPLNIRAALGVVELQPGEIAVYRPDVRVKDGYTSFKRLQ